MTQTTGFIPLPPLSVQTALLDWVLGVLPGTPIELETLTEFIHNQKCEAWTPQQTTSRLLSRLCHHGMFCMYIEKDIGCVFRRVDRTTEPRLTDQLFGVPKTAKKRSATKKPYRTLKQRFKQKKHRDSFDGYTSYPQAVPNSNSLGKLLTLVKKEDLPSGSTPSDILADLELDVDTHADGGVSDDNDCEGGDYDD
jgi:hypothetical protein